MDKDLVLAERRVEEAISEYKKLAGRSKKADLLLRASWAGEVFSGDAVAMSMEDATKLKKYQDKVTNHSFIRSILMSTGVADTINEFFGRILSIKMFPEPEVEEAA